MKIYKIILLVLITTYYGNAFGQATSTLDSTTIAKITGFIEKQDKKVFHFGFSIGLRTGIGSEKESRAVATVLPDSNHFINIEYQDMMAFLLSTSMTAFPFPKKTAFANFGFTANINLLEISDASVGSVFNKTIDGGFGFAYAFDKERQFAVAATYERTSTRRPKNWVIENTGKPIIIDGKPISSIDANDDTYYIDTGLNAWSIKFIYHFK